MAETLEICLISILEQLDLRYEILVVDDGSSDSSLEILELISRRYTNFRYIPLLRDKRRRLGDTRNISIEAARGKYIILHLDCDDKWNNHIDSFVRVYHGISKRLEIKNFMLSGYQIHIAPKKLLTRNRYQNVYYTEDRILWSQLAAKGKLLCINHKIFRERIPLKGKRKKILKIFKSQLSSMIVSFSYSPKPLNDFIKYLRRIFLKSDWGLYNSILNLFFLIPSLAYVILFNRAKRIDFVKYNYREFCNLDLNKLEKKYLMNHGKLNLSKQERADYFLD